MTKTHFLKTEQSAANSPAYFDYEPINYKRDFDYDFMKRVPFWEKEDEKRYESNEDENN